MDSIIVFAAKYPVYISAVIALAYFFKQPRAKQKEIFIFAAILLPFSYIIAKIASLFFFDPRPFVVGNFSPLIPHAPDNGFPSDHTLLGAAIALAIFHFNKKLGGLLLLLALLTGLARVAAGVHHIVDIAGSIAIVMATYFFTRFFLISFSSRRNRITHT